MTNETKSTHRERTNQGKAVTTTVCMSIGGCAAKDSGAGALVGRAPCKKRGTAIRIDQWSGRKGLQPDNPPCSIRRTAGDN